MRLNTTEREAVQAACREEMPPGTRVLLFGSRLDDGRLGGDIDLLVELPEELVASEVVERRTRFAARLYRLLDEQRIDVLMAGPQDRADRAVLVEARRHGVELARS